MIGAPAPFCPRSMPLFRFHGALINHLEFRDSPIKHFSSKVFKYEWNDPLTAKPEIAPVSQCENGRSFCCARKRPARDRTFAKPSLYGVAPFWANRDYPRPYRPVRRYGDNPHIEEAQRRCLERPRNAYRTVPRVPPAYFDTLDTAYGITEAQEVEKDCQCSFWPSTDASMADVKSVYGLKAGIPDARIGCKGFRMGSGWSHFQRGDNSICLRNGWGMRPIWTTAI